jgi:hypothetical protein
MMRSRKRNKKHTHTHMTTHTNLECKTHFKKIIMEENAHKIPITTTKPPNLERGKRSLGVPGKIN